jgi:hypothetical protein
MTAFDTITRYAVNPTDRLSHSVGVNAGQVRTTQSDLGDYWTTTNPTPGSALAYNVQAAFSSVTPFLYLFNSASAGGVSVYLDYIKIIVTTAAASGTRAYYALIADQAARTLTTDHTSALTPAGPNQATANAAASVLTVNAQNSATASVIAAASSAARLVGRGSLGGATVAGDELIIDFGSNGPFAYNGATAAIVNPSCQTSGTAPVILDPQACLMVALWFPNNVTTGLSYELEMGHWEQ